MKMVKAMCVLACCAGVSLMAAGCSHNDKKASPGAMGAKSDCCSTDAKATKAPAKGSMGAVSDKKSDCCSSGDKSGCTAH